MTRPTRLLARRASQILRAEGPAGLMARAWRRLRLGLAPSSRLDAQYALWLGRRERRRDPPGSVAVGSGPRISVVTPVASIAEVWLRRTVESVLDQTYDDWELLLVEDGPRAPHVRRVLDEFAARDPRIRVTHLPERRGISGASNHGIDAATGEFVAFLDHDDELYADALAEVARHLAQNPHVDVLYSDEDKIEPDGRRTQPFFKPDWSPDLLLSLNYIGHLTVVRRGLLLEVGGLRSGFDGSQDHDLLLRLAERTSRIAHLPRVLYGWRRIPGSVAADPLAKPAAYAAAVRALGEALDRRGIAATVEVAAPGRYHVRYAIRERALVSIVVPMRDRADLTRRCLASIERHSTYPAREIVLVDNGSTERASLDFLRQMATRHRVVRHPGPFNYAAVCNVGARHARGAHLLFLNNDTEVEAPDWLEALLEHSQRSEVGAVGARLLYPNRRIQHAGAFLMGEPAPFAGHTFKHLPEHTDAWRGLAHVVRNVSAVTGACLMVRRVVFDEVAGFDEAIAVAFGDIDLCLRIRARGYLVIYTPLARLLHRESATRRGPAPAGDARLVMARWRELLRRGDPYYNPNLTRLREDVGLDV